MPPLAPPRMALTTSDVSSSSPWPPACAASCSSSVPMSDGIESKPQVWTIRAPLARAAASAASIAQRMNRTSPVRSA